AAATRARAGGGTQQRLGLSATDEPGRRSHHRSYSLPQPLAQYRRRPHGLDHRRRRWPAAVRPDERTPARPLPRRLPPRPLAVASLNFFLTPPLFDIGADQWGRTVGALQRERPIEAIPQQGPSRLLLSVHPWLPYRTCGCPRLCVAGRQAISYNPGPNLRLAISEKTCDSTCPLPTMNKPSLPMPG